MFTWNTWELQDPLVKPSLEMWRTSTSSLLSSVLMKTILKLGFRLGTARLSVSAERL